MVAYEERGTFCYRFGLRRQCSGRLRQQAAVAGGARRRRAVTVSKPLQKTITEWDEYTGRFEAMATVEVRARVSGFIDSIHFRDGQIVKQGDLLFVIDQRPYQIAVEQAKADLERARAKYDVATADVDRATPLVRNQTLDRARVRHAEVDAARRRGPGRLGRGRAQAGRSSISNGARCARRSPGGFPTGASMPAI